MIWIDVEYEPTVKLFEGMQTPFKENKVLYIIAADSEWVSHCFNEKYKEFQSLADGATTIGNKFLQKSIQLTVSVPKIREDVLKTYSNNQIGDYTNLLKKQEVVENTDNLEYEDSQNTEHEIVKEKKKVEENIPKYLRQFLELGIPDNPVK
jgi:hypothetical protein